MMAKRKELYTWQQNVAIPKLCLRYWSTAALAWTSETPREKHPCTVPLSRSNYLLIN